MAEKKTFNGCDVKLMIGDITDIEFEAFVYYANNDLDLGSGYGNAISMRGGPSIKKELTELAPIGDSQAVVSAAGELKAKHIVHAVGPKFQEENTNGKLKSTIFNALDRAKEKNIKQLAFPAMGAGFYGIPLDTCADISLTTVKEYLEKNGGFEEIIFSVLSNREFKPFQASFDKLK